MTDHTKDNSTRECPVCPKKIKYSHTEYSRDLDKYLSIIKEGDRADETLYRERIEKCLSCTSYENGLCMECGCFIEFRCILKKNKCPSAAQKW